jgi:hypothetical protein
MSGNQWDSQHFEQAMHSRACRIAKNTSSFICMYPAVGFVLRE